MKIHGMQTSNDFLLRIFTVAHIPLLSGGWRAESVYDPFWRFYENERDGFEIFYEAEGKTKTAEMRAGECYLIPAQTLFSGRNTAASQHFYIHFDVVGALPFTVRSAASPIIHAPLGSAAREALLEPLKDATRMAEKEAPEKIVEPVNTMRTRALLHETVAVCLEQGIMTLSESNRDAVAVRPALDFIEGHLHEHLTNNILAEHCHFSTDHFIEKFRLATESTPGQYVLERRLSVAAQRLLFSSDSIETIAIATGFCDRFHLSRAFKKRFGQTPVAYRKSRLV